MNLNFEELRKQVISLNLNRIAEIETFNSDELKIYVNSEMVRIKELIQIEIDSLRNEKINTLENLYENMEYDITNKNLPILLPQLNLLERIKLDLQNV